MNIWASTFLYPATLFGAFLLYFLTFSMTQSYLVALYIGVSTSAAVIFILEKIFPFHPEWKPTNKELISDIFQYTVLVQAALPLALYFLGMKLVPKLNLWPVHLPIFIQFLMMAIIGEFFQYWWHRLAHTYKILWPIHAIHHFPQKLYAWNTAQFHPLDKFIEFIFTVFIFFVLGMPLEVFAYYYIFYAVTGYFQHSNLDIKFGPLDYVIASGETHRFHHDSNYELSKCNYANNLVLFDLLFGTFKRKPEFALEKVGVRSPFKPENFLEETLYPFKQWKMALFNLILKASMMHVKRTFVRELNEAATDPLSAQLNLLQTILKKNKETVFGKEHHFGEIKTYEDFKKYVPVRDFEAHRHYIEAILSGKTNALTAEAPHYFAKTSGSTGKPKYIPVNPGTQKRYVKTQQLIAWSIYNVQPDFLSGSIFSIVGNEVEETLSGKWPCGSMSGKLYSLANPLVRAKHIFQTDISLLNDSEKKYLYLAALALLSPDTTFYASPNPSTLMKIFETINFKRDELTKLLEDKDDTILKKFHKTRPIALLLLAQNKTLTIKEVWPALKVATLWMEGSCSYLIPRIKESASSNVYFNELGYVASEFYGSVPVGLKKDVQIPTLLDNFFEFIEADQYESGHYEIKLVDQLEAGKEYYVIVTTTSGLYRYFINDIIKVTGKYNNSPVIVFSQKGKGITNLTGEKLSEKQIVTFFDDKAVDFFICLADQESQSYQLYLEAETQLSSLHLEEELDSFLKTTNIEFASKRKDERLGAIKVFLLRKGSSEQFKEFCLANGQRESQFKFLHLQYKKDVPFDFKRLLK